MKEQIIAMKKMSLTMQSIINLYARKHVEDKARLDLKIVELRLQLDAAGGINQRESFNAVTSIAVALCGTAVEKLLAG